MEDNKEEMVEVDLGTQEEEEETILNKGKPPRPYNKGVIFAIEVVMLQKIVGSRENLNVTIVTSLGA